jgi:hypothetical protein
LCSAAPNPFLRKPVGLTSIVLHQNRFKRIAHNILHKSHVSTPFTVDSITFAWNNLSSILSALNSHFLLHMIDTNGKKTINWIGINISVVTDRTYKQTDTLRVYLDFS